MRQPVKLLPKLWLMTDERNDAVLNDVIQKMPRRSGIVFRHYHLKESDRGKRFARVKKLARKHHHLILLAGHPGLARKWRADGVHGRQWKRRETKGLLHSAPVHDMEEIRQARFHGAEIFFLSPAFATRSHPGAKPLNNLQLRQLSTACREPVILLGGMDRRRFHSMNHLDAYGWAAIDALSQS